MPYPIKCLLKVDEIIKEWLLVFPEVLPLYSQVEDLLCCTSTLPESCLLLGNDFFLLVAARNLLRMTRKRILLG